MTTHLYRSPLALLISSLFSLTLAGTALALPEISVDSVKQLEGQPGAVKAIALNNSPIASDATRRSR